ncbi:MAG: hypothetical protein NTV34_07980 [Proteobacteria bacterium]|nr:hypothetical protein [Pseudomonadota bacterium]
MTMQRKSTCSRHLIYLIAAGAALSCGQSPQTIAREDVEQNNYRFNPAQLDYSLPEGISVGDLNFIKGSKAVAGLAKKVHNPSIRLCYTDPSNSAARMEIAKSAILKWVSALTPITDKPLATIVEIAAWNSAGCDAYFAVGNYSPANTSMGSVPRVNVASSGWYGSETVILHELGHAFGLLDTYNGRGGSCQSGQPSSVMCYAKFKDLMQDDILGVQAVYRSISGI